MLASLFLAAEKACEQAHSMNWPGAFAFVGVFVVIGFLGWCFMKYLS